MTDMKIRSEDVRALKLRREAELQIVIEKAAGDEGLCRRTLVASTADDAMDGIAILIVEFANALGVSVPEVVARLAVKLLHGPEKTDG